MQNLEFRKTRDTNYDAPKGRGQEWLLIRALVPCSGRGVLGGTAQKVCVSIFLPQNLLRFLLRSHRCDWVL